MSDDSTKSAVIQEGMRKDIQYIKNSVDELKELVNNHYVTKDEFEPIQRIVYGIVGLILTSVIVALLALVIGQNHG